MRCSFKNMAKGALAASIWLGAVIQLMGIMLSFAFFIIYLTAFFGCEENTIYACRQDNLVLPIITIIKAAFSSMEFLLNAMTSLLLAVKEKCYCSDRTQGLFARTEEGARIRTSVGRNLISTLVFFLATALYTGASVLGYRGEHTPRHTVEEDSIADVLAFLGLFIAFTGSMLFFAFNMKRFKSSCCDCSPREGITESSSLLDLDPGHPEIQTPQ